jgi:hypothetical protein
MRDTVAASHVRVSTDAVQIVASDGAAKTAEVCIDCLLPVG